MSRTNTLLTPAEVAREYRRSTSTLAKDRLSGTGPRYVKMGSRVYYHRDDLDAWINSLKRSSTSEADA